MVVGDQSSGKSSVLESLTGFSFPRAVNLCTRYATQITCCRDSTESVTISIIARPGADEKLKKKLSAFRRQIVGPLGHDQLAGVFKAVSTLIHLLPINDIHQTDPARRTLPWASE